MDSETLLAISTLTKFLGIPISGFFGVYGLVHDYKDNKSGKLTSHGLIALVGILLGSTLSATAFLADRQIAHESQVAADLERSNLTEQLETAERQRQVAIGLAENTQIRLNEISNSAQFEEATIEFLIKDSTRQLASGLSKFPWVPILTTSQLWECAKRESVSRTDFAERIRAEFFSRELDCDTYDGIGTRFQLPRIRVSFADNSESNIVDAFFRIDANQSIAPTARAPGTVWWTNSEDQFYYEIDDVPVRFRTNSILSLQDLAGKKLFFEFSPGQLFTNNSEAVVEVVRLDIDLSDGRDLVLGPSDLNHFYLTGSLVQVEFVFPEKTDELLALFD